MRSIIFPLLLLTCCSHGAAVAQSWPSRPIIMIVADEPGSGLDYVARVSAKLLDEKLGQPILIENHAGSNGVNAIRAALAKEAGSHRGHTILIATPSIIINELINKTSAGSDVRRDFSPITALVEPYVSLYVNTSVKASNVRELVEWAMTNPGKISYASSGTGSEAQLLGELFNQAAGINLRRADYNSPSNALRSVGKNDDPMGFAPLISVIPLIREGKLRILSILNKNRFSRLPGTQTVGETLPNFEYPPLWYGYLMAGGDMNPRPLYRIHSELMSTMATPTVRKSLEDLGLRSIGSTPKEFKSQIDSDFDAYANAIKIAKIAP